MVSKLQELRTLVANFTKESTDEKTIGQSAVIAAKMDELEAENNDQQKRYEDLLNRYKDAVIHSSFQSQSAGDLGAARQGTPKTVEEFLAGWKKK